MTAALAAALVFGVWYPGAFRQMSGGQGLFVLLVSVDVILGPLLTFSVFDLGKGWPHLRRDLAVIGAVQLAGLAYGLHTVYNVRPVAVVFEVDRFRVVAAVDVQRPELPKAMPQYRSLPLDGPWVLSARRPEDGRERTDALFTAVEQGIDVGQRPAFWRPYADGRAEALARSRPVQLLIGRYADRAPEIRAALADAHLAQVDARFLPVIARGDWVAILDARGEIATYVAADGFF